MPLSEYEQRVLKQIENALSVEDPKLASIVSSTGFRALTMRRRILGTALFVIGLAMLVSGVAIKATMLGSFPLLSVFGFLVMFAGTVFAIPDPRNGGLIDRFDTGTRKRRRGKDRSGGSFAV